MGIEKRKRTVRWDEDTFAYESDLLSDFAPFAEDPSHLSRIVYRIFHRIVRTRGIVEIVTEHLQRQQKQTLSAQLELEFPAFPLEVGKKPPCRISEKDPVRRLAYSAINRTDAVGRVTSRITPFRKPLNFNRFGMTRRVA